MVQMTFGEAKIAAVAQAMRQDERVIIIGGAAFGGHRYMTLGAPLVQEFPKRVYATPIAELGYVGVAVGAAMTGLRPIVTVSTSSFVYEAWPQIINEAPNIYYMTAGQTKVPMMVHLLTGIRTAGAAQHSARPQAMFMQTPGLQIISPATAEDALVMVQPALDSERPTVWIDHALLMEEDIRGSSSVQGQQTAFGKAAIRRAGKDVTLVTYGITTVRGLNAAERAAAEGIDVEVVDLRTLCPLDRDTVLESAGRTRRLVIADECSLTCGVSAEIAASVAEAGVDLAKPLKRMNTPDVPIPFSPLEEQELIPSEDKILAALRGVM
ncbi:MAG: pyruvate dehydrogenase E1 component beta subunit [Chloroflexi bacterium]|jgi:pyruvate/2-oxoglutarate/acetoin dehydrogenase E1 component|nr:MAG: pyruvate dehydrogenase E1 component beta subunit [Chloroflexota bacterium]